MEIGNYVSIRDLNDLVKLAKTEQGKMNVRWWLHRNVEAEGFMLATIVKHSPRKWYLQEFMTYDNGWCFDIEDKDTLTFTADWYDIKTLNAAVPVKYDNEFFGIREEYRISAE